VETLVNLNSAKFRYLYLKKKITTSDPSQLFLFSMGDEGVMELRESLRELGA
jgi:hypothetical protein